MGMNELMDLKEAYEKLIEEIYQYAKKKRDNYVKNGIPWDNFDILMGKIEKFREEGTKVKCPECDGKGYIFKH